MVIHKRVRRPSVSTLAVLQALMARPTEGHYGLELSELAQLATGTVYPILRRLEQNGWVTSSWEDVDPAREGRPRRRLYFVTGSGATLAREALTEHRLRFAPLDAHGAIGVGT